MSKYPTIRGDHFRFGSVRFLSKKVTTLNFFIKKNRNRTGTGSNWPVSIRFGFLGQKPVQTGLTWFFGLTRFFASLAQFFSVWVRFGFFGFRLIKPKPNWTGRFFQNFNRFFFIVRFFNYFFPIFSVFWFFFSPL